MIRKLSLFAVGASALLVLAGQAAAQVIIPALPLNPRVKQPKIDGLQDLQKQLDDAFGRAGAGLQPGGGVNDGSMRRGGVRLTKVDADLRAKLGLEEKEGLVVASVDPNSAADKAGLKADDVLIKIAGKSVPSELESFSKLLKDAKVDESADIVVIRKGKEETLKGAKMPAVVQGPGGGRPGIAGRPGGIGIAGALGGLNQRILIQQRGIGGQTIKNITIEYADGSKLSRKQDNEKFSGEFSKADLKIAVSGKIENGRAVLGEATITEGKESKKYTTLAEVPAQHRLAVQRLVTGTSLSTIPNLPNLQGLPELQGFPFPMIPGFDD
jgi:hypothetical protein